MEIKITVFAYLLSDEEFNSFPKHLNLALTPNKTNERVKNNETSGNMANFGALSLVWRRSESIQTRATQMHIYFKAT